MRHFPLTLILMLTAAPALAAPENEAAAALPVVTSTAPGKVSVTIYRDPNRGSAAIYKGNPSAFALITETRTITLPKGEAVVRFEGVAGGIVPKSAIMFNADPKERNRDAALLSQKGLVDGFTGQSVILKRTNPATGVVTEERVTVRSAANRLVVTGPGGSEALYCSGLNQTLLYPGAPAGLSAKPVLSMTTRDQPGGTITVTLAYIATGFDWDATYVATLSDDGRSLDLMSWLTMASGDDTSFVDADAAAVAGKVNRSYKTYDDTGVRAKNDAANLNKAWSCWPSETTTSNLGEYGAPPPYPPPPPPPPAPMVMAMEMADIIVTGSSRNRAAKPALIAKSEDLGDLKLYTIPAAVTVAARSQKQVAFLAAEKIPGKLYYRIQVDGGPGDLAQVFRFKNTASDGLGKPLPAGKVILYQGSRWGTQMVGETTLTDKTLEEEVELVFGQPTGITLETTQVQIGTKGKDEAKVTTWAQRVTLKNANPFAVEIEFEFPADTTDYPKLPGKLIAKPGKKVLAMTLKAGATEVIDWRFFERY